MKRFYTTLTAFALLFVTAAVASPVFADETHSDQTEANAEVLSVQDVVNLVNGLFVTDASKGEVGISFNLDTTEEDYTNALSAVHALDDSEPLKQGLLDKLEAAVDQYIGLKAVNALYDETHTGLNFDGNFDLDFVFSLITDLPQGEFKMSLLDKHSVAVHYYELLVIASYLVDDNGFAVYQLEAMDGSILEIDEDEFQLIALQIADLPEGSFKDLLYGQVELASKDRASYSYEVVSNFEKFTGKNTISTTINAPLNGLQELTLFDNETRALIPVTIESDNGKTVLKLDESGLSILDDGSYTIEATYVGGKVVTSEFEIARNGKPDPVKPDPITPDPVKPDPVKPDPAKPETPDPKKPTDNKNTLPSTGIGSDSSALYIGLGLITTGALFIALRKREENN